MLSLSQSIWLAIRSRRAYDHYEIIPLNVGHHGFSPWPSQPIALQDGCLPLPSLTLGINKVGLLIIRIIRLSGIIGHGASILFCSETTL